MASRLPRDLQRFSPAERREAILVLWGGPMASRLPRDLQRFSPAERREAILEAAREVFGEMGLAGARTKTIAERAGVAEGLVFKYFKNKEYLFEVAVLEVLEALVKRIESAATEFAAASGTKQGRAEHARIFHAELYEAMVEIAPLLGGVLFEKRDVGESFYKRILGPAITRIAEALSISIEAMPLHVDARMLTLVFFGTHFLTAVDATYRQAEVDPDEFAKAFTSLLSHGFGAG